ncbi:unnamed protein product [Chrysodeixis includens]|uniref:Uncharacterized protein n=1 Tax=Chrysodeixis includens TaxID=689277 RepID=A0A9P0C1G9_CHRIL|nr:unnamed protein product [Chrysodeixis includens]
MQQSSVGGAKYFLSFIDDYTRKQFIYFLKSKDETFEYFKQFKALVENETGKKLKVLRSDRGGEYMSSKFQEYVKTCGIKHQKTIPDCPQQNGVAERANRTIMEKVRCLLRDAGLEMKFWAEAVNTAVYLKNRSPTKAVAGVTPEEKWTSKKMIYAERFEEDTVYSKLMSTLSIEDSSTDTLSALQIIFSREETDLKVLSIALTKLDDLIRKENNNLDKKQLSMMMNQILKFKSNNTIDSKDARIFQKDVALFLGKYGSMVRSENFSEDIYVLKLRNKITLNIPNVVEATTFKIDLQRVLQLCLLWEEREPLYSLLVILSANLSDRTDPDLQEATIRVIHALFRTKRGETETDIAVYPALLMCNTLACVQTLMKIITQEQCPTNRRKLSDCLEVLLTQDTEVTSQLVDTVAENVMYLLSTDDCSTIQLSLDITRAFLSTFKDNNSLAIKHLPQIIISTSNHKETEIFDLATKIYIEKIDLFNTENIKNTILNVIEKYIGNNNNVDIKIILEFIKQIVDIKKYDTECMINGVFDFCKKMSFSISQFLNIFALLANFNVFEVSCEVKTNIVCFNSGMFLNELMKIEFGKDDGFNKAPVLEFLKEYCMELYGMAPEKTSQCIFSIIENVDPKTIIILKKEITECLNIYKPLLNDVKLQQSYKKWLEKRNLDKITDLIKEKCLFSDFTQDISDKIQALKIISHLFNYTIEEVKNWTVLLLENLTDLELKWGKVFLSDVFFLSEKSLSKSDFEKILNGNLDFCKRYINVYFGRLLEQDLNLNGDQSMLLIDVIEYYSKDYKEEYFDSVLKFVDKLWPTFELTSNLDQKQSILLNLLSLPKPVGIDCLPVKWAVCLLTTEGGSLEDKTKIVRTLPAGEQYSILYRAFASNLPVRLCEMQGPYVAPLRALLDTLAGNGDPTLLDIVITLAGGDDTKGWWDHAIDACMASLAKRQDKAILSKAYHRATAGHSLAVCNRVFLPLLRHSARKFCEEYICTIVPELLSTRVACKQPADTESYRRQVKRYTITFNVLKIVFDKLPSEILECSVLNESAGSVKPWHFTEQACRYCVTISASTKCGEGASPELREACLWLQSAAYNCLTAAICRRKPNKKLYTRIFDAHAWANIVDKDAVYPFELQAYSTYRGTRSPRKPLEMLPSSSFTGTVRSRLFLTTLTENPLQYDMIPDEEDDLEDDQPPELEDSVLDAHGCLSTLTALLEHAATLEHNDWRSILIACLTAGTVLNVKWLLSQAICNASESLKSHAGELTPGLLQLIADTPQAYNNKFVLNNLHLEILTTIINWNSTDLPKNEHLDVSIEYLISTIMQYKHRKNLQRRLLNILNNILQIYGHMVIIKWTTFKDYCKDPPKDIFSLLPIFEKILKNKVHLPDLLPNIFLITDAKVWSGTYKLSEVCGLALSLADSATRGRYLPKYWQILNSARGYNVTGYIKILYYTQRYCRECCDLQQIKNITDLSAKIEKSKCLTIIANYLETADEFEPYCQDIFEIIFLCDLLEGEFKIEAMRIVGNGLKFMSAGLKEQVLGIVAQNCKNSSVAVRKEAYGVILKAFQAEFKPHHHYSTKRRLLDTTPILDSIDTEPHVVMALAGGLCDPDVVGTGLLEGLGECLSEDLTLRFAELFYILVYQSFYTKINNLDLRNCGHTLLTMLFKDLRNNDAFINSKLREEGLPQSILQVYETLTTKTKPKTMLRSSVTYRQTYKKVAERREIDVQISINELLDTFLQLAKTNTDACLELCAQVMKCLQGASRRFDLSSIISRQLYGIVKREPNSLTPLVLEACRIFVNGVSGVQGFKDSVSLMNVNLRNTEGYMYTNILYEDLLLRNGDRDQFVYRMMAEDTDIKMRDQEFSIEGLIDIFGSLSSWETLRSQERRQLENCLPTLWVTESDFRVKLREYFDKAGKVLDYSLWFNKMVASYYPNEVIQDRISWLRETDLWPKRDFVTSAIIEAIQWHEPGFARVPTRMRAEDCLAETAARLMIRSSFHHLNSYSDDHDTVNRLSVGDELAWCKEANHRQLPYLVLQCVERNKQSLLDVDILPWVTEKVSAYRTIGLKDTNCISLQKALDAAERQALKYGDQSSLETNVSIQKLILQLNNDLNSLSTTKLDDVIQNVNTQLSQQGIVSCKNKQVLKSFYEEALIFYNDQWNDDDKATQNSILLNMSDIICNILDHNLSQDYDLLLSGLFNRLAYSGVVVNERTAEKILDQVYRVFHSLDSFSVAILKKIIPMLPPLKEKYLEKFKDSVDTCKKYFQLICDVNYSLLQYCDILRRNLTDKTTWDKTFESIKEILETPFGGTDYQSLITIKNKLYALQHMDDNEAKDTHLKSIIPELLAKSQRHNLRLSQLCPSLTTATTVTQCNRQLQSLLRLPRNVHVVKFAEQVSVFTDSIRRPCVIKVLLSNGCSRRYLVKSGESLYRDAAIQRVAAMLPSVAASSHVVSYHVTPLGEESAIIEYLEDHVRLRDLMQKQFDINNIGIPRAANEALILAPSLALEQYHAMCDKVPSHILRSAIELDSSCVSEFIIKKQTFANTLASMTILNWLFDIGDRHLQNVLYNSRGGALCGVDLAATHATPPARLTRCLLAVTTRNVLESRLQNMLSSLRESQKLLEAFIKTSFYWMGPHFEELQPLLSILSGTSVSYDISKRYIESSGKTHKEKHLELLDEVFKDFVPKACYSVEEQISCLLHHCTDPKILSVTSPGWEAWL